MSEDGCTMIEVRLQGYNYRGPGSDITPYRRICELGFGYGAPWAIATSV